MKLNKKQLQKMRDMAEAEGADYYFLQGGDFSKITDPKFKLRLSEWHQARAELLRYVGIDWE